MHLRNSSGTVGRRLMTAFVLSAFLMTGIAAAAMITVDYEFSAPEVTALSDYSRITMDGAWSVGEPGMPVLPRAGASVLIPPGERIVSIEVIPQEWIALSGSYLIEAGQSQYPLSFEGSVTPDLPNSSVYSSDAPFPGRLADDPISGLYRGYRIANVALHPVEYLPASGQISYMTRCELRIYTEFDAASLEESRAMIRHDLSTLKRLENIVDNHNEIASYANLEREAGNRSLDPADAIKYVIVTSDAYAPYLGDFVTFQTERGLKAEVFLKDWINSEYTGGDEQTRIRNFIVDAYATWDTDYVLLVGDSGPSDGIPHRGMYAVAYGTTETNLPSDLYYACLDGSWNDDGDGYWGEIGEADLYHELGVGRAAVSSPTELQNWLVKQMRYQTAPVASECKEALMCAELLWSEPTWGGDYKDEILFGASTWGYTTEGFPDHMNVHTLYDREGTWSSSTLINMMNNGLNIINHLGHCDYTYMMKFYNSSISSFTNDGINHSYNFIYSQGCMCGGFDQDSISENLNNDEHGAVALITNSRYGWGMHESTNGSSQYFDREFYDAMFAEEIYPLADVNNDSKEDVIWNLSYGANRWCFYELNLFGDPSMHLWTDTPGNLQVTLPGVVFIGQPEMEVTVTDAGAPLAGVRVCAYTDDYSSYSTAYTNAFGVAILEPGATAPGDLNVKIVAHDFYEYSGMVPILPPEGPYLVFDHCIIFDDEGDNDGILDEGETVDLDICVENVGVDATYDVVGTLSCDDGYVSILVGTQDFGDIPSGSLGTCLLPFEIYIDGAVPDEHVMQFTITMVSAEGMWESTFYLTAQAPVLSAGALTVIDLPGGNGSGNADAGETVSLRVEILNSGHSAAENLVGLIGSMDPNVTILDSGGDCPLVPVGGTGLMSQFEVEILSTCPEPSSIDFFFNVSDGDFAADMHFEMPVGGWFDDFEIDRGWTVGAPGDDADSGIWTRVDPIGTVYDSQQVQPEDDHTPAPGVMCYVTGQGSVGGSAGENDIDYGVTTLLSPVFNLQGATSAEFSYWRWYSNNAGNNPDEDWWDVEVTADGLVWVSLEHTQTSDNSWTYHSFDLSQFIALSNHVQVRFQASDEVNGSLVEAAVDDVLLNAFIPLATGADEAVLPAHLVLGRNFPNPFNPKTTLRFALPTSGTVALAVYDVQGRRVATLANGPMDAGYHEIEWLGLDDAGKSVSSGVYFSRIAFGKEVLTNKMLMLK